MSMMMRILCLITLIGAATIATASDLAALPDATGTQPVPAEDCNQAIDTDCDGVPDTSDNCLYLFNAGQENNDGDSLGDVCDIDDDNDGVSDTGGGGSNPCPTTDTCGTTFFCTNSGLLCSDDSECTGPALTDTCITTIATCAIGGTSCLTNSECPALPDVCRALCNNSAAQCTSDADCTVSGCDDNCPFTYNPDQADTETEPDGVGDACDNCLNDPNPDQSDLDLDGLGDACDSDPDGDQIPSSGFAGPCSVVPDTNGDPIGSNLNCNDNCPLAYNPFQWDHDSDLIGSVCDNCLTTSNNAQLDGDGDGVGDACDNCPTDSNSDQLNGDPPDDDAFGDACDNCPNDDNPTQLDFDFDGAGNACDDCPWDYDPGSPDLDDDGIPDVCDPCPGDVTSDADGDGVCGSIDNCPRVSNSNQSDIDLDGIGDVCDCDQDGDGTVDKPSVRNADNAIVLCGVSQDCADLLDYALLRSLLAYDEYPGCGNDTLLTPIVGDPIPILWGPPCCLDNCPSTDNDQTNNDADVAGATCDPDDNDPSVPTYLPATFDVDFDGVAGSADNCPNTFNADQTDTDLDLFGDACDPDLDGDLASNTVDNCPAIQNDGQIDTDHDGRGDACDNCPLVANAGQADRDRDTVGDACDLSDDLILLLFHDRNTLTWQQEVGFDDYILVAGDLGDLRSTGEYVQPGGAVDCGPSTDWSVGGTQPVEGQAAFFLVGGRTGSIQNGFGRRVDGGLRIADDVCP